MASPIALTLSRAGVTHQSAGIGEVASLRSYGLEPVMMNMQSAPSLHREVCFTFATSVTPDPGPISSGAAPSLSKTSVPAIMTRWMGLLCVCQPR